MPLEKENRLREKIGNLPPLKKREKSHADLFAMNMVLWHTRLARQVALCFEFTYPCTIIHCRK